MDLLSLVGLLVGVGAILLGQFLEGGHISSLLNGPAILIVAGGTLGAIMLQFPMSLFIQALRQLKWVFFPPVESGEEIIEKLSVGVMWPVEKVCWDWNHFQIQKRMIFPDVA